jgi:hypothetical protein
MLDGLFDVVVLSFRGDAPEPLAATLERLLDVSHTEAHRLARSVPCVVAPQIAYARAEGLVASLQIAGADARIERAAATAPKARGMPVDPFTETLEGAPSIVPTSSPPHPIRAPASAGAASPTSHGAASASSARLVSDRAPASPWSHTLPVRDLREAAAHASTAPAWDAPALAPAPVFLEPPASFPHMAPLARAELKSVPENDMVAPLPAQAPRDGERLSSFAPTPATLDAAARSGPGKRVSLLSSIALKLVSREVEVAREETAERPKGSRFAGLEPFAARSALLDRSKSSSTAQSGLHTPRKRWLSFRANAGASAADFTPLAASSDGGQDATRLFWLMAALWVSVGMLLWYYGIF